jgi:HAD superfamily hydrolase (TIGR01509 family)
MTAVLLDVDGTLVDSTYLHVVTWARALAEHDRTVPQARIHRAIGMGGDKMLGWLLGEVSEELGESMSVRHRELFLAERARLRPLPGARDFVAELVHRGLPVVLATSAAPPERDALLEALALEVQVAAVTDAGDVDESKPEPDLLQVALDRVGSEPESAVMIGDARWDIEAAKRAGVTGIGMLSGGISESELLAAGAARVYEDPAALLAGLDASPIALL